MKKILKAIAITLGVVVIGTTVFFAAQPSPQKICTLSSEWQVKGTSATALNHPMGLAWGDGFLYVADTENGAVKKIGPDGTIMADWKTFKRPVAVATSTDFIYVADFVADQIVKLDSSGNIVSRWGRTGRGSGEFDAPSGIAVDGQGNVYVADFYNHRIQKFDASGKYLTQWGGIGRWNGQLRYPTEIAVNGAGEVFVADAYNQRIQKFTAKGKFIGKWGGTGYGTAGKWPGWFKLPKGIGTDSKGHVFVADAFNRRVQKFSDSGTYLGEWPIAQDKSKAPQYPASVAADANGNLYVSGFFKNRIYRLQCG